MRRDAWPILGAIAAFAALVAVSWRATPDRHDTVIGLYIAAGTLELAGVATIGLDILARQRRIAAYQQASRIVNASALMQREGRLAATATVSGPQPTIEERLRQLEERAEGEAERVRAEVESATGKLEQAFRFADNAIDRDARKRESEIVALIGPGESALPAWIGFAGLLLGVLVGTVANILSATA